MTTNPDEYFSRGCGRCKFYATLNCKVHNWTEELALFREVIRSTDLVEEAKWGVPCYTDAGKNILILSAFRDYCSVSFFKGVLLSDPAGILISPTANSHADRAIRVRSLEEAKAAAQHLPGYIAEAIDHERQGHGVPSRPVSDIDVVQEFQEMMDADPAICEAFQALTPGRRKGYLLHFAQAKQSKTRISRIEKCLPKIFDGLGLNDRYD